MKFYHTTLLIVITGLFVAGCAAPGGIGRNPLLDVADLQATANNLTAVAQIGEQNVRATQVAEEEQARMLQQTVDASSTQSAGIFQATSTAMAIAVQAANETAHWNNVTEIAKYSQGTVTANEAIVATGIPQTSVAAMATEAAIVVSINTNKTTSRWMNFLFGFGIFFLVICLTVIVIVFMVIMKEFVITMRTFAWQKRRFVVTPWGVVDVESVDGPKLLPRPRPLRDLSEVNPEEIEAEEIQEDLEIQGQLYLDGNSSTPEGVIDIHDPQTQALMFVQQAIEINGRGAIDIPRYTYMTNVSAQTWVRITDWLVARNLIVKSQGRTTIVNRERVKNLGVLEKALQNIPNITVRADQTSPPFPDDDLAYAGEEDNEQTV